MIKIYLSSILKLVGSVMFIASAICLQIQNCLGQDSPPPPPAGVIEVKIDLVNQQITDGKVPFGVPIQFVAESDKMADTFKNMDNLQILSIIMPGTCGDQKPFSDLASFTGELSSSTWTLKKNPVFQNISSIRFNNTFPLNPNRDYCLISAKKDANKAFPDPVFSRINLRPKSSLGDHLKSDFGVGYVPKIKATIGIVSVHLYFTAINNDTDLGYPDLPFRTQLLSRISLFGGISPILFSSDTEQPVTNLTKLGNVVYGVGIRSPFYYPNPGKFGRLFLQPMRINFGIMRFFQENANPLITSNVGKSASFISVTYDLNIAQLLGPIGKLFQ